MSEHRPFKRVTDENWVGGVIGGLAYSLGWNALLMRVVFFLVVFILSGKYIDHLGAIFFPLYILLWIFAPTWDADPDDYEERTA